MPSDDLVREMLDKIHCDELHCALPNWAAFGSSGAAARRRVRRSPRRALALGPRPARPRRPSRTEPLNQRRLSGTQTRLRRRAVFLALNCPSHDSRVKGLAAMRKMAPDQDCCSCQVRIRSQ